MRQFLCMLLLLIGGGVVGQVRNVNPNPDGEPWYVGGIVPETFNRELAESSQLQLHALKGSLPYKVDNSQEMYFRPVFNQQGGSCGQASGIAYNFTYEINRLQKSDASLAENQFPSHFTYNFLNEGSADNGSWYWDGWDIIKQMGCPTVADYGGLSYGGSTRWLDGFDAYRNGMKYKVKEYHSIDISTETGIEELKRWLYDYGKSYSVGGLANFAVLMDDLEMKTLPQLYDADASYKKIITKFGTQEGGHAMTIVGYNDSVKYDFNADGKYTNDVDITGDGVVDMRDWEKGAFKFVNSWGASWANSGFAYFPYRLAAMSYSQGGLMNEFAWVVQGEIREPRYALEVTLDYGKRNNLKLSAGYTNMYNGTSSQKSIEYKAFKYAGGDFAMQGAGTSTDKRNITIGLDVSSIVTANSGKVYFQVNESDAYNDQKGELQYCVLHDLSNDIQYEGSPEVLPISSYQYQTAVLQSSYAPMVMRPDTLYPTVKGAVIDEQFIVEGGVGPYVFSLQEAQGSLPEGISIGEDGALTGTVATPVTDSLYVFTVLAEDAYHVFQSMTYAWQLGEGISSTTSIEGGLYEDQIKIFPVPVRSESFFVQLSEDCISSVIIEVYSVDGQLCLERKCYGGQRNIEIPISMLGFGVYFVRVTEQNGLFSYNAKIVIE